ncbi:hypothetical protein D3C75_1012520 [compost metagenome]
MTPGVRVNTLLPAGEVTSPVAAGSRAAGSVPLERSAAERVARSASEEPALLILDQPMAAALLTSASTMTPGAIAVTPSPVLVTSPV